MLQNVHNTLQLGMCLMDCTLLNKGMTEQQAEDQNKNIYNVAIGKIAENLKCPHLITHCP